MSHARLDLNDAIEVVHHESNRTILVTNAESHEFELKRGILHKGADEPDRSLTEAHEEPAWRRRLYCRCAIASCADLRRIHHLPPGRSEYDLPGNPASSATPRRSVNVST